MQTDWLFWGIAFLFFLPMHLGTPLLYLLLQGGPASVRAQLPMILFRGTLSALLAFALAMWIWPHSKAGAAAIIGTTLIHPWLELAYRRYKK